MQPPASTASPDSSREPSAIRDARGFPDELRPMPEPVQVRDHIPDMGKSDITLANRLVQTGLMALDHCLPRSVAEKWLAGPRNKVQERIREDLRKRPPGRVFEIPRRRNLGPEEFYREYLRPGLPVVMEGMTDDWPCREKWDLQFFADRYGDDEVVVTGGNPQTSEGSVKASVTLRDVVENSDPEDMKYLRFHPLISLHPELAADIPIEWFERYRRRPCLYSQTQFFIGTRGTDTGIHNSQMANLFAMIRGEKEWLLFPTAYTAFLDPPTTHSVYRMSRFNRGHFYDPSYAQLDCYHVHLKAGDVLWNPSFWWHTVRNLTDTIGVGYRWNDHVLGMKMSASMMLLDVFARDPSWYEMMKMCRAETRLVRAGRKAARESRQAN